MQQSCHSSGTEDAPHAVCQDNEQFTFLQQIIVNDIENPVIAISLADTTIVVNPSNCMALVDLSGYVSAKRF